MVDGLWHLISCVWSELSSTTIQQPYDTFLTNTQTINREVTLNTDSSMHANTSTHGELIEHRPKMTANRPPHSKTQLKLFFHRIHYAPGIKAPGDIIFPFFTEQKLLSISLYVLKSQSLSPQHPKKLKGKINNNLCQHQGCRNPKDRVLEKKNIAFWKRTLHRFMRPWSFTCQRLLGPRRFRTELQRITEPVNTELLSNPRSLHLRHVKQDRTKLLKSQIFTQCFTLQNCLQKAS